MGNLSELENLHILLSAVKKLKEQIQPAEKGEATFYWTTLKFQEAIFEITGHSFSNENITEVLIQDFFINEYIQNVGLVWLVKEIEN